MEIKRGESMKIINIFMCASLIASSSIFAQTGTTTQPQTTQPQTTQPQTVKPQTISKQNLLVAQKGCQKPIGFFPTPAKLMCLMGALGISQQDAKPKALALIFNVCHGRVSQAQPAGTQAKSYGTLGECLSDPAAITIINTELKSQGLPEVNVVNKDVLTTQPATPASTGTN